MKIIKQGLGEEEWKRKAKEIRRFKCDRCECIFEAEKSEYKSSSQYNETYYYCECPNCRYSAYETTETIKC